jgi:hypothetical protein
LKPVVVAIATFLGIGSAVIGAAAKDDSAGHDDSAQNDPTPVAPPVAAPPTSDSPKSNDSPASSLPAPSTDPAPASQPAPSSEPLPPSEPAPAVESRDTTSARASEEEKVDEGTTDATSDSWKTDPNQKTRLPWHGSMLLFDQSVTTTTVGIGAPYQSADPVYEWWLAFKPRYAIYESKLESFSVSLWANLYLELTNSDSTTTEHEPVIGPTWVSASYGRTLFERDGYKTSMNIGPRFSIPTDKASRNTGQIMGLGATVGISQRLPLNGDGAPALNTVRFSLSATYNHPISKSTTPVGGPGQPGQTLGAPVEDLGNGRTTGVQGTTGGTDPITQDQLSGGLLTRHALTVALSGDLQVTPKLGFSLAYSLLNRWSYQPTDMTVCVLTGCVEPIRVDGPTTFRPSNWLTASVDYDLFDEVGLSLGYYNQALQLGPDGQRRGILWSPEARFFFTISGNLDAIYEALANKPSTTTAHR